MRQRAGEENKHLYVSVGKNDLSFGYGRHACPGRYLGHLNIKLVLAEILLRYDIKLPAGKGRPHNDEFEAIVRTYTRLIDTYNIQKLELTSDRYLLTLKLKY